MAIATALHRAIDAGPDRWAVITGDRAYRYQDLGEQIQRRATQLQAITPRAAWIDPRLTPCTRRIAVLLDAGLDILVTLVANAQLGGVTLVLNPDWALAQLTATLRHYPPDGLITDARWLPLARALGIPAWDVNTLTQPSDSPQPLPPPRLAHRSHHPVLHWLHLRHHRATQGHCAPSAVLAG
jgi:acyl-CoA synthetase (AMP-forming)/AMP-acid ligase II